jgi:hypothetical protein
MPKLLIHAGYPKAASTTLQNKLFMELHRAGQINFLGRAFESGYSGVATREAYKDWFWTVAKDRADASEAEYRAVFPELSPDKLNLFSEGLFLTTEHHAEQYLMAARLHRFFVRRTSRIEVLFVLRSQVSLVMSYYVQKYAKMQQRSFDGFLRSNQETGWAGEAKVFNLHALVTSYAKVFGDENVRFAFFEDLTKDRPRFCADLGRALGITAAKVDRLLGSEHLNATRRSSAGSIVKKLGHSPRARLLLLCDKLGLPLADRLRVRIPPITGDQEEQIYATFKESNQRLAEEYGLDQERMQRYRYV